MHLALFTSFSQQKLCAVPTLYGVHRTSTISFVIYSCLSTSFSTAFSVHYVLSPAFFWSLLSYRCMRCGSGFDPHMRSKLGYGVYFVTRERRRGEEAAIPTMLLTVKIYQSRIHSLNKTLGKTFYKSHNFYKGKKLTK